MDLRRFVEEERERFRAEREPSYPFPPEEYRSRLERLRARMAAERLDVLLVSSPEAMCWLHGYRSRWWKMQSPTVWPPLQCTAVHLERDPYVTFDTEEHRELLRLTSVSQDHRLSREEDLDHMLPFIVRELAALGWLQGARVGMEFWSPVPNRAVSEALQAALEAEGATVVDASAVTRDVRRIKSPLEIAKIEEAARICEIGLAALREVCRPGVTELEAWAEMMRAMAAAGGEPAAIHECVVVGPVELGHAISSRRVIRRGDHLFADPCGVVDRYHANIAATIFVGEPPPEAVRIAEIEAGAFDVLCAVARDGVEVRTVNAALREYYRESGLWGLHAWTGGYELGLSFPPDWVGEFVFTVDDEDPEGCFRAGMVTNFESIIHYPMIDTVVYEATGARTLGTRPRGLIVVD